MVNSNCSRSVNSWVLFNLIKSESVCVRVCVCVCVCVCPRVNVAAPEVKPLLIRNVFTRDYILA